MYDRKIFLYFALAIIGFFLWNAWQADYGPKPTTATSVTAAPSSGALSQTNATVPTQEIPQNGMTPQNRTIQVKTDTMDVRIDKEGGNILSLKLPQYPTSYETPQNPQPVLIDDLANYYTAQSAIVAKNGPDTAKLMFTTPQDSYQLDPTTDTLNVVLTSQKDGMTIKKIYTFKKGKYDLNINYEISNQSKQPWTGNLYAQIKRRGLTSDTGMFGLHTYTGAAISSGAKPYEKISYKEMDKSNLDKVSKGGWLAMQERYFVSAFVPNQQDNVRYYSNVTLVGSGDTSANKIYTIGYQSPVITIAPKATSKVGTVFYAGPEIADNLKEVAPHLDEVIDYGWLSVFSIPIFKVMAWIYQFVGNWGLAIILVTVLIKLLFYKLSETSYRSMARMRNLQPKLLALKDRYGDDRQKLSQATMELYRKEKVNPLGGCLPMIIQIPVFIALYYVLIESVQLRQAPFIFWIHDLSVKDPFYVLPILMGLSWMLQQRLNPPPPDPVQAKMMMLFPVVFTILFATFPAGLVLYWIVNNCLSILQQWYIMKKVDHEAKRKPLVKKGRVSSSR